MNMVHSHAMKVNEKQIASQFHLIQSRPIKKVAAAHFFFALFSLAFHFSIAEKHSWCTIFGKLFSNFITRSSSLLTMPKYSQRQLHRMLFIRKCTRVVWVARLIVSLHLVCDVFCRCAIMFHTFHFAIDEEELVFARSCVCVCANEISMRKLRTTLRNGVGRRWEWHRLKLDDAYVVIHYEKFIFWCTWALWA